MVILLLLQSAVATHSSDLKSTEKKSTKSTAGSSQSKRSQSSLLAGAVKRKG